MLIALSNCFPYFISGFGDSEESSENDELFPGSMNDPFMPGHEGSPYYLNALDADYNYNTLNTPWEVINVADIKSYTDNVNGMAGGNAFASLLPSSSANKANMAVNGNNNDNLLISNFIDSFSSNNNVNNNTNNNNNNNSNNNNNNNSSSSSCNNNSIVFPTIKSGVFHSVAVDHRIQTSAGLLPEVRLSMLNATHTSTLHAAVTAPLQVGNTNTLIRVGQLVLFFINSC